MYKIFDLLASIKKHTEELITVIFQVSTLQTHGNLICSKNTDESLDESRQV